MSDLGVPNESSYSLGSSLSLIPESKLEKKEEILFSLIYSTLKNCYFFSSKNK